MTDKPVSQVLSEAGLLPCPFCGGDRARTIHIRDGRKVACICGACSSPQFHGPLDRPDAEVRAIAAWNTRAENAYLVWSNEHQAWWGKDRCGYTRQIERAGRYERAEAMSIAGTRDGGWHVRKGNPDETAIPERDAVEQYAAITAALAKEQGR